MQVPSLRRDVTTRRAHCVIDRKLPALRSTRDPKPEPTRNRAREALASVPTLADAVRQIALLRGVRKYGIALISPDGRVRSWNHGADRMTGLRETEIVGQPYAALLGSDAAPGTAERLLGFARTHGHHRCDMQRARRDGVDFMAACTLDVIAGGGGDVVAYLEIVDDITERKEREHLLYHQATRDALTGLLNRGHFVELAGTEIARAQRFGEPLALIMVDIDHFKHVNDRHGHLVGDEVLTLLAQRLQASARRTDYVGRIGGEEFAVLLPRASLEAALRGATRLHADVGASPFPTSAGALPLTVSVGVAMLRPGMNDFSDLLRSADVALYRAKSEGRNCIRSDLGEHDA